MEKKVVFTPDAPAAIGPYSQAIAAGNMLYTSGQLGIDPQTGDPCNGVEAQTRQALLNLSAILQCNGMTCADIVKTTVFVTDLKDFTTVNAVYQTFFTGNCPARSCVQVAALPKGGLVEIECVAVK